MDTPYLIQRAKINRPMVDDRLSKAVNLDYMGSAEFEFGALPKSLRFLQANMDNIKMTVEPRIDDSDGRSLRVLHTFDENEYGQYLEHLLNLRDGKVRTKECTRFEKDYTFRSEYFVTDFWWDIGNHVMWTFDKVFSKKLVDVLVHSWTYMDSK